MVSLKEKVEALGLLDVDSNPLTIAELYQLYQHNPNKRFKYYKPFGDSFMYYSVEYLDKTPIEQLLLNDICNQIR